MRLIFPAFVIAMAGCSQSYVTHRPVCGSEPLGTVAVDKVGQAGISPAEVIAAIDGAALPVLFEPVHDALDASDAFADTLVIAATADGLASEELVEGTPADAPTGPNVPVCPAGALLTVPVTLTVTAESGFTADLVARVWAMGPEPSQMWVQSTATVRVDAPAWLQELADDVAGPNGPATLDFGLHGEYWQADEDWTRHPATIVVRASGAETLFEALPAE